MRMSQRAQGQILYHLTQKKTKVMIIPIIQEGSLRFHHEKIHSGVSYTQV